MADLQLTFTGPVSINQIDTDALAAALAAPILAALAAQEARMTTFDEALAALQASVDTLTADEAADRAAFDSLATAVRAFLANLPPAGGVLTDGQAAAAQALQASIDAAAASDTQEATDEAALQAEVPPVA